MADTTTLKTRYSEAQKTHFKNAVKSMGNEAYTASQVSSPQQGGTEESVGLTGFELFVFDVVEGVLSRSLVSSPLLRIQMMQQVEPELYRIGCIPSPYATAPITGKYDATPYKKLVDLPPHKNYISNLLRSWSETEATRREHELNSQIYNARAAAYRNAGVQYPYNPPSLATPTGYLGSNSHPDASRIGVIVDPLQQLEQQVPGSITNHNGVRPVLPTVHERRLFRRSGVASTAAYRMDQYATESYHSLVGSLTRGLALHHSWTFALTWFVNALSVNVCKIAFNQEANAPSHKPPESPVSPLALREITDLERDFDTTREERTSQRLANDKDNAKPDVLTKKTTSWWRKLFGKTFTRWKTQFPVVLLSSLLLIPVKSAMVFVNSIPHSSIKDWWHTVKKDEYGPLALYRSLPLLLGEWFLSDFVFHTAASLLTKYLFPSISSTPEVESQITPPRPSATYAMSDMNREKNRPHSPSEIPTYPFEDTFSNSSLPSGEDNSIDESYDRNKDTDRTSAFTWEDSPTPLRQTKARLSPIIPSTITDENHLHSPYPMFTPRDRLYKERTLRSSSAGRKRRFWAGDHVLPEDKTKEATVWNRGYKGSSSPRTTQGIPLVSKITFVSLLSSGLATAAIYPLQTLRTRMSLDIGLPSYLSKNSISHTFKRIMSLEGAGALWAGLPAALAVLLIDEMCRFVMQQARLWYIKHKHSVHGVLKNTGGY